MSQYIDKSALLAEIKRLAEVKPIDEFQPQVQNKIDWLSGKLFVINSLQVFLDTLEVKEVDLDEEIETCLKRHSMLAVGKKDFTDIAKHFFELGLKASQPTTYVYGIEEALKENGIDPDSKEADMYREAIYKIYDRLKALKGK